VTVLRPSVLLIVGAFAAITVPRMAQPGMFIDGVTYAVVSRNLAQGLGSFWYPFYTASVYPQFHEQPPLGFALQAAAFSIFGDHLAVERVYSLAMGLLTGAMIVGLWRKTIRDSTHDWLPIVFWLVPSTVSWGIVNNMLETTQAVFTTGAVLCVVLSVDARRGSLVWAAVAGLLTLAAALVKGPNGFFPIAAPAIAALVLHDRAAAAVKTGAVMIGTVTVGVTAVLLPESSRTSLWMYWNQHVRAAMSGERGGARLAAVGALMRHLAGGIFMRMGALLVIFAALGSGLGRERRGIDPGAMRWAIFFLVLGLSGSVPVLLSTKIAGHYLIPSIPIYALGFAALAHPLVERLRRRFESRSLDRAIGVFGVALLVLAIVVPMMRIPVEPRDVGWIAEYRVVGSSLTRGATIGTCPAVADDWGLHAYMQRLFGVSLDSEGPRRHRLYLQLTDRPCEAPPGCSVVTSADRLRLFDQAACTPPAERAP
jgi:4-amino-4-deoxy-L-arabinose transferase-like glycosyltransferase